MDKENVFALFASFLVLWSCGLQFSHAARSTITVGQAITVYDTIASAGNDFEMGFYNFSNSTNYYLGIWYKKVSLRTIVWTANRDNPFSRSSVSLTIGEDGNLVIMDDKLLYMVSSIQTTGNTSATLQDSGNLVLRDENSTVLWQSFDFPTDTFLPGMKIGYDRINGRNWSLVSSKNLNDPGSGVYNLIPDPNGTTQIFIMKGTQIYWTSGAWNGRIFSLVPEMRLNYIFNYTYVLNENENYFTYSLYNRSIFSKLVMDVSGQIKQSSWLEGQKSWVLFWSVPRDQCEVYGSCGAFATCNTELSNTYYCTCLRGFEPQNPSDWASGSYSGGCARKADLQCNISTADVTASTDKFIATRNSLAENPLLMDAQSIQDCELSCLKKCRCTAYAYSNYNCSTWEGELLNLRENIDTSVPDLHVRLAASEFSTGGRKSKTKLWIIIASVVLLTVLGLSVLLCWLRKRKLRGEGKDLLSFDFNAIHGASKYELSKDDMATPNAGKEVDIPLFSLSSVSAASNDFCSANKLGEGGFGPVYKGKLLNGYEVAVKRLSRSSGQGWEELKNEAMLIGKLQHKNLVKLLGCCIEGDEKILIYEYLPNKSLDLFLFRPSKHGILDWSNRVHIIEGIAQGLLYLHQFSRVQIIHRDLKASNILLDEDMNPKISDFGMARIFSGKNSQATKRIVGTYGYMSPEYASHGIFSVKSDVFSFGVLLLEILSGKKNTGFYNCDCLHLLGYAWELWKNGRSLELTDPVLEEETPDVGTVRYINIALLCVQEYASDRPTMAEVVAMLSNEGASLPFPKQPAFTDSRGLPDPNQSKRDNQAFSANEVTVSILNAR